ncbi:MAG: ThiF family adenylyltransferase [Kaistella sp.]|nr:ThiF family adenylyltransferase [Kaistella sp.]
MINFEAARTEAYDGLALTNTIEKVFTPVKSKLGLITKKELWQVTVEIPLGDAVKDFNLIIDLGRDFPLSLPEVYLSEKDYDAIKYIPHVSDKRNICLFDQENIKIDAERPADIVKVCLNRAVKIISDGVNKVNSTDFKDEIVAYWSNTYDSKDKVVNAYLSDGTSTFVPGKIPVYYLSPSYHKTNLFFGTETEDSKKVLDFFELRGHRIDKDDAFYLGTIDILEPDFYFDNNRLLLFIKENFTSLWPQAKTYINQGLGPKNFIFSMEVDEEQIFFGFHLYPFKTNLKGWRAQSLSAVKIMSKAQPTQPVTRVTFTFFSYERIRKRTDGVLNKQAPWKFMVAGLGSIGSNLLFYLSTLEVSNFILVDPEILQLENINRHLLSFHEVGQNKVDAVGKYLTYNNPFLSIGKYPTSVVNVIQRQLTSINDMDLIFCAIGKDAVENYLLQCSTEGKIRKPIVLLWVEPYLLGAHILYINPFSGFKLKDLESEGYYEYNIISKDSYSDPEKQILLREAGCQGSYTPYGKEAIVRFFAVFIPELFSLIKDKPVTNMRLTYAGDYSLAATSGLKISEFGKQLLSNQLVKHTL